MIRVPKNYSVSSKLKLVDTWFLPEIVLEIKVADIQLSPVHSCGLALLGKEKGLGLRFPRLLRERSDKSPLQCTTNQQIKKVFEEQAILNL